jgi:uncharacterized membrane protein YoaK (UPF0700 family)
VPDVVLTHTGQGLSDERRQGFQNISLGLGARSNNAEPDRDAAVQNPAFQNPAVQTRAFIVTDDPPEATVTARLRFSLLSFTAGFADTTTFLGLHGLFSAHVTGSLLLLVVSIGHGWHSSDTFKVLALPLFALTAAVAEHFRSRFMCAQWLSLEANLLMLAALFGLLTHAHPSLGFEFGVMVCAVTGMALQTYLGRIHPAEYGLTTIMTNNLVQIVINLRQFKENDKVRQHLLNDVARVAGFAVGCLIGAILTRWFGMVGFALPAVLVLLVANGSSNLEASKRPAHGSSGFTPRDPLRSETLRVSRQTVGDSRGSDPASPVTVVLPPEIHPGLTLSEPRASTPSRPS